jgi:hypothetical protein
MTFTQNGKMKSALSLGTLLLMAATSQAQTDTTVTGSTTTTEGTVIRRSTTVQANGQNSETLVGVGDVAPLPNTTVTTTVEGSSSQVGVESSGGTAVSTQSSSRTGYRSGYTTQTRRVYTTRRTYRTVPVYSSSGRVISSRRVYRTSRVYRTVPVRRATYRSNQQGRARRAFMKTGG